MLSPQTAKPTSHLFPEHETRLSTGHLEFCSSVSEIEIPSPEQTVMALQYVVRIHSRRARSHINPENMLVTLCVSLIWFQPSSRQISLYEV